MSNHANKIYKELSEDERKTLQQLTEQRQENNLIEWIDRTIKNLSSKQKQDFCKTWKENRFSLKLWYIQNFIKQDGCCKYCKVPQKFIRDIYSRQNGWREGKKTQDNKKGTRGWSLEIDRKKPKNKYSEENCVLACYPCNNAKSDVFTAEEFIIIGAVIGALKKKDKLIKLKNNKFIKGLINDVTRATNGKI